MTESNSEAILRLENKVDSLIKNDIRHLQERNPDGWRFLGKVFGAGGAGVLAVEFIIRVLLPMIQQMR